MQTTILEVSSSLGGVTVADPDAGAVERAATALLPDGESFLRLELDECKYLQASCIGPETYYMDFRESADDPNYCAPEVSLKVLQSTLEAYRSGGDFKVGIEWQASANDELPLGYEPSDDEMAAFEAGLAGEFDRPFVFNDTTDPDQIKGFIGYHGLAEWWLNEFTTEERRVIEEADHQQADSFDDDAFSSWSDKVLGEEGQGGEIDKEHDADEELAELMADDDDPFCVTSSWVSVTRGQVALSADSSGEYLAGLAGTMNAGNTRALSLRIAGKAKSLLDGLSRDGLKPKKSSSLHFTYSHLMSTFYRSRDESEGALDQAIACAQAMIALAPKVASDPDMRIGDSGLPLHDGFKQLAIIYEKRGEMTEAIELCRQAQAQGWDGDWSKRIARYQKKMGKKAA